MKSRASTFWFGGAVAAALTSGGLIFASPVGGDPLNSESPVVPPPTACSVGKAVVLPLNGGVVSTTLTESCVFDPGTNVAVTYHGAVVEVLTAPASGLITLHLSAADPGDPGDPELSIDGTAFQPAIFGVNTMVGTGINPAGASNTATFLLDISQPVATLTASGSSGGSTGTGAGAGTGTSGNGTTPGSIGLAFTGANLIALIAAGLSLTLFGGGVVAYTRRRAAARHTVAAVQESYWATTAGNPSWPLANVW
ncbi:MAG TPA: hypothetical protein VG298_14580 [Acidimicrobiales bacterium]|nr:hypothetical protein [Acidimicrobiales bacterium]